MVKINDRGWRIRLVSANHPKLLRQNTYALGSCDNNTSSIYIADNVSPNKLKQVLAHELAHAVIFSYHLDLEPQTEELIADLIGTYGNEIIKLTNILFKKIKNRG